MTPNDVIILESCGIIGVVFWFIGFSSLVVAAKKARPEFRVKGYLRTPTGTRWLRFLLYKQYDVFSNPSTRFYFAVTHFCMMGLIFVFAIITLLLGSEFLLNGLNGLPTGGWIK